MSFFEKNFINIKQKKEKNKFTQFIFNLFGFLIKVASLFFAPIIWSYGEILKLYDFAFKHKEDKVITENEKELLETIPTIYTLTGFISGVFVALFAITDFQKIIENFVNALSTDLLDTILNLIGSLIIWIYNIFVWVFTLIGNIFNWIFQTFLSAFAINPFLGLFGLLVFGFLLIFVYISFNEKITKEIQRLIFYFVESPDRFKSKVKGFYSKINHGQFYLLLGDKFQNNTYSYFKRLVFYSFILFVYSIISSATIALNPEYSADFSNGLKVLFIITVFLVGGFLSGTLFFALIGHLLNYFVHRTLKKAKEKEEEKVVLEEQLFLEEENQ